ncbi:MAG: DUF1259 domain-containing protein [Firmicutes bacterium]|nr:DUF1259 domain-containing protein [Bacillota bacterium]
MARGLCAFACAVALADTATAWFAQQPAGGWQAVARTLGRTGEENEGVYSVSFPREDLDVRVEKVRLRPALALTSWVAFQPIGETAMVMGDLVLQEKEVADVIRRLVDGGLIVTAVHNHLVGESPKLIYVHFHGRGDAVALARSARAALEVTGTPLELRPLRAPRLPTLSDAVPPSEMRLRDILGHRGWSSVGVTHFRIPRAEAITVGGTVLSPRMGVATMIHFQAVGSSAVVTGDFVLRAEEVPPVVRALSEAGIAVTALHNHLLEEEPRLFFLHFWGQADATTLAAGLRRALDLTHHARPSEAPSGPGGLR